MRFSLAQQFRRVRNPRRKVVKLRPIVAQGIHATDLYQQVYAPVIAMWSAALPGILDEYARTLATMQTDSPADVSARISAVKLTETSLFMSIRARIERWAAKIEAWQRAKWRANVLTATGVDLATMIGPADVRATVAATIEQNVALVSSVSDQTRQRIADAVFRGFQRRAPAEEIGRELRQAVDMGRRRAKNVAADQVSKLAGALNDERRRQAGIDSWFWRHSAKRHPRPVHLARNGNLYTDNPERIGTEYEGKTILKAPADRPSQLPYCGCVAQSCLIID